MNKKCEYNCKIIRQGVGTFTKKNFFRMEWRILLPLSEWWIFNSTQCTVTEGYGKKNVNVFVRTLLLESVNSNVDGCSSSCALNGSLKFSFKLNNRVVLIVYDCVWMVKFFLNNSRPPKLFHLMKKKFYSSFTLFTRTGVVPQRPFFIVNYGKIGIFNAMVRGGIWAGEVNL